MRCPPKDAEHTFRIGYLLMAFKQHSPSHEAYTTPQASVLHES